MQTGDHSRRLAFPCRATYCLGGIPRTSLDVAGYGLMWRSAAPTVAGRGPASPSICRRWLPVWLPGISLASLTFGPDRKQYRPEIGLTTQRDGRIRENARRPADRRGN